jgi:hypothetical protein
MHWTWLVVLLAVAACDAPPERRVGGDDFLPRRNVRQDLTSQPAAVAPLYRCLEGRDGRAPVRGVLRQELRAGPPGYGESPGTDRRDTILVLETPLATRDCTDTSSFAPPPMLRLEHRMQLLDAPREVLGRLGDTVTVFGAPEPQTFGWHYTPVLLRVDSIPELRRAGRGR